MTLLNKPMRRPVPLACTATAMALLFLIAGGRGYTLSKHDAFVAGTRWAHGPIWWQVYVGVALVSLASWLWLRAVRSLQR